MVWDPLKHRLQRLRFQYTKDEKTHGPLCRTCMNSRNRLGHLVGISDLVIAARPAIPLQLDEILLSNGTQTPFHFGEDFDVRRNLIFSTCSECGIDEHGNVLLKEDVPQLAADLNALNITEKPGRSGKKEISEDDLLVKDMKVVHRIGPFLNGTQDNNKALGAAHLKKILSELREVMTYFSCPFDKKKLDAVCISRNWKASKCKICSDVEATENYFDHILSVKHHGNLSSSKRFVTLAEYHVLNNILQRTKRCCIDRTDNTLIGIRAPFLNGQTRIDMRGGSVPEDVLKARVQLFRNETKLLPMDSIHSGCTTMIPFNSLRRCIHCEVDLNRATYLPHALSEKHIDKVLSTGRRFYNEDIGLMACLVRFCGLLFQDDEDCKILKDDKDNVKPPPFLLGHLPSEVDDAMTLEEALEFAKRTAAEDFCLMNAADELKDMGYKVRTLHCSYCVKSTRSKGNSCVHITSEHHIRQVMLAGRVFSMSRDRDLLIAASNKAKQKIQRRKQKLYQINKKQFGKPKDVQQKKRMPPQKKQPSPPKQTTETLQASKSETE